MKSKHFAIHELVPPHIFEKFGEKAWKFIDSRLIESIDALKEHFNLGTMTINNYYWGGDRKWSGLRTPQSPYYSETSQHSLGNAIDAVFSHYSAKDVRNYIIDNQHKFPHIKGVELDVGWVHVDVRNEDHIQLFNK